MGTHEAAAHGVSPGYGLTTIPEGTWSMTDTSPTPLNVETLNTLGGRLFDHSGLGASIEFEPIVGDLKSAARVLSRVASLRPGVGSWRAFG